jgi:hypothetical protein
VQVFLEDWREVMKTMRLKGKAGLAVMTVAAWLPVYSQSAAGDASAANGLRIAAAYPRAAGGCSGEVVREIDDPHTGDRWKLMRDPAHPARPGRLVLVAEPGIEPVSARTSDRKQPALSATKQMQFHPVIHAGDALIVEEHTAMVEARLEAVAMGPAAEGVIFRVRLKIGGKVVRAVAVSTGHAVFAPEEAAQP